MMCSTIEQIENFLKSSPADCLNLSTNNGLDLSCSSSQYAEGLNLSNRNPAISAPPSGIPSHEKPQEGLNLSLQNGIVNLSTNDSRNFFYETRETEEYYGPSGYERNSPLNLERRSSPLNLTFASKRDVPNNYGYNAEGNGYYVENPCEYDNNETQEYSYAYNNHNNPHNQMYCGYNHNQYYNDNNQSQEQMSLGQQHNYYACSNCASTFRDQISLESHSKRCQKITPIGSMWSNHQPNPYHQGNNYQNTTNGHSSSNTPQNYVMRQEEMSSFQYIQSPQTDIQIHQIPQQQPSRVINEPLQSCTACSMTFNAGRDLKKHIDLVHEGRKKSLSECKTYQCTLCSKEFDDTGSLGAHALEHRQDRPYKCDKCSQLFRNPSGLRRHLKRVHGNEKQSFKCEQCRKGFYEKHDLARHIKIHAVPKCGDCGRPLKNSAHECKKKPRSKSFYSCEICMDSLDSKIAWGYHMWKHTKDSSYITTMEDNPIAEESTSNPPPKAHHNQYLRGPSQPLCLQKSVSYLDEPKPLNMHQNNN